MPILKKLIPQGGSKNISIPKSWLDYCESEAGRVVDAVSIEVNGELRIRPYFPPKKEEIVGV